MKILSLFVSLLLIFAASSCKSHKATVVRASRPGVRVENSAKIPSGASSDPSFSNNQKLGDALVKAAKTWIGTPYRYGGQTKSGTDCSGMTMVIYKDVANMALPRTAAQQAEYCFDIPQRDLQPGDLVFFTTSSRGGKVSHVGMYIGGGKMIHASTSRGVIESSLDEKYYKNHYHSSGRVYGITYAGTGEKKSKGDKSSSKTVASSSSQKPAAAPTSSGKSKTEQSPASRSGVVEMTLDQFVAMKQSNPLRDTVIVAEHVIEATVAALDSASAMVDSVRAKVPADTVAEVRYVPDLPVANIDGPGKIVDGKKVTVRPVRVENADSTDEVRSVPDLPAANINGPTVIVNGQRVPVTPVRVDTVKNTDKVEADSVRQGREIRESVVKAMKFGK